MELRLVSVVGLVMTIGAAALWQAIIRDSPIDPLPTTLSDPPPAVGVYARNSHLRKLRPLGATLLPHPEDVTLSRDGRFLFAACSDGWIKQVELSSGEVRNWSLVAAGSRPLGLALGLHGEVLACEPSLGLLNVTEGKVSVLSDNVDGIKFKFADALDVSEEDGSIYFSDASSKFGFGQAELDLLEARPNGRVLRYDPATQRTTVVARDLYFPNGVAVSKDGSFLVFCETGKVRCQRLWLKGDRKLEAEVFVDNLPGYPDNIHRTERGTFWVGLVFERSASLEAVQRFLPVAKKVLAREAVLRTIQGKSAREAKVLEVSEEGTPLRYLQDPGGQSIGYVTSALEHHNTLYLGGLAEDFVGALDLTLVVL